MRLIRANQTYIYVYDQLHGTKNIRVRVRVQQRRVQQRHEELTCLGTNFPAAGSRAHSTTPVSPAVANKYSEVARRLRSTVKFVFKYRTRS